MRETVVSGPDTGTAYTVYYGRVVHLITSKRVLPLTPIVPSPILKTVDAACSGASP